MIGKIIKIISNQYTVKDDDNNIYNCIAMGKVRLQTTPFVGDNVEFVYRDDKYTIERILERTNYLIRPAVANIDQLIIVMSAKDPEFSETLVDRITFLATFAKIKCVLCITKTDLVEDVSSIVDKYQKIMQVVTCDKYHVEDALKELIADKISVLTGQSGVGKSTLLNTLNPDFKLKTQEISKALNRGKHTTRHTEIYFAKNIAFCDTPGFSSLDLKEYTKEEIRSSFMEFKKYSCKFQDCLHLKEFGCAIKEALEAGQIAKSRYQSYQKMLEESNNGNSRIILKKSSKYRNNN